MAPLVALGPLRCFIFWVVFPIILSLTVIRSCLLRHSVPMHDCNGALTPPDTPSHPKDHSPAAELERLSIVIPSVINSRDFDFKSPAAQELLTHVSSDFLSQIDTLPQQGRTVSWAEQVAAWRSRAQEYPDVSFAVRSVSSTVDDTKGSAQVYVEMEVSGIGDVKLHAMNELRWKRIDGKWMWCYVVGMRGTPGNSGLD